MNRVRENGGSRAAFDLFHPGCRHNFKMAIKLSHSWKRWAFWKLVWSDTRNRVCSKPKYVYEEADE